MKYVYLVQERHIRNGEKREFSGIGYYTSYKKALKDFNEKLERYKNCELVDKFDEVGTYLITHIREYKIDDTFNAEIQLLKHEVY